MAIEYKDPFRSTLLEEEKSDKYGVTFTIRMNKKEMELLRESKRILDTPQNGTAVKALVEIGQNVLHTQLKGVVLERLFKKDRVRNR